MYAPPRQRERGTRWQLHSDLLLAAVVVAPPSSSSPPPPLAPHEDAPGEPTQEYNSGELSSGRHLVPGHSTFQVL